MAYVLRQVHAHGKSALADEATAAALAKAAVEGQMRYGQYLHWFDPDANDGYGLFGWTDDIAKARRFPSFRAAMECWKQESSVRPLRDDGRPNRPLTAFSVTPEQLV
jgi:hypothetical protein